MMGENIQPRACVTIKPRNIHLPGHTLQEGARKTNTQTNKQTHKHTNTQTHKQAADLYTFLKVVQDCHKLSQLGPILPLTLTLGGDRFGVSRSRYVHA